MKQIVSQLKSWQRREWTYSASLNVAVVVAAVAVGVALACLTDFLVDRVQDTPFWVRVMLAVVQVVVYLGLAVLLFVRLRPPTLVALAGRAEKAHPKLDHRLVTALQLNRTGARTVGMSELLIAQVTDQAGAMAARLRLPKLADTGRLKWAGGLALGTLLFAAGLLLLSYPVGFVLLKRQLLLDVPIPHSVEIENATPALLPAGDGVQLRVLARGRVDDTATGRVVVSPDGQASEPHPLKFEGWEPDGTTARFVTDPLPPSSTPFTFRAWVRDGRMHKPARVEFAPRPVVKSVTAVVVLPAYVDPNPDAAKKRRYERPTAEGEVVCHPDCAVRVDTTVSKAVASATLVVSGRGPEKGAKETDLLRLPMTLGGDRTTASVRFDLPPRPTAYRIEAVDDNGFANSVSPKRGITVTPDLPPTVALLDELLKTGADTGPNEDYDVTGMPLTLSGQVLVGYSADSPLGVDKAYIVYRVFDAAKKTWTDWVSLSLTPVPDPDEKAGRFVRDLGVFASSEAFQSIEFYSIPSPDPDSVPPGLSAGGRYSFQTANLLKGVDPKTGKGQKLQVGDQVEFYVAAYDRKPGKRMPVTEPREKAFADPGDATRTDYGRPAGYSTVRQKTVKTLSEFEAWNRDRDQSRDKLKALEEKQRGVFGQKPRPQ